MAFELGTDLHTANFDYGDAPIDIGGTVKLANGACHLLRNDLLLGALVDIDEDGQPAIDAAGDDQDGFDDEDGIEFMGEAVQGELALAAVTVSAPGFLNAWLDMNDNGEWESFEQIFRQMELDAGIHVLEFPVFDETEPGEKVVRFRFSSWPHIGPKGFAPDGEVEDHIIDVQPSTDVGFSSDLPGSNMLHPNYPNPFNPETTIAYEIGTPGHVRLLIFDMLGRQVAELVNDRQKPGQYMIRWNGRDREGRSVTSGMYIVVLESGSFRKTGKLLLVR